MRLDVLGVSFGEFEIKNSWGLHAEKLLLREAWLLECLLSASLAKNFLVRSLNVLNGLNLIKLDNWLFGNLIIQFRKDFFRSQKCAALVLSKKKNLLFLFQCWISTDSADSINRVCWTQCHAVQATKWSSPSVWQECLTSCQQNWASNWLSAFTCKLLLGGACGWTWKLKKRNGIPNWT